MKKRSLGIIFLILMVGVAASIGRAQDWPLTQDDVKILLIGGAKPEKMVEMIQRRGVDFQMSPDIAKKLHDLGATDAIIDALQRASAKRGASSTTGATPASTAAPSAGSAGASASAPPNAPAQTAKPAASTQSHASVQEKIDRTLAEKTPVVDETSSEAARLPRQPACQALRWARPLPLRRKPPT